MFTIHEDKRLARRVLLLASVATFSLQAMPAWAQSYGPQDTATGISGAWLEAQGAGASATPFTSTKITAVAPDPQIVIADPGTPATNVDPNYVSGVGQMIADIGDGFLGLCTATLINPRTVVFAAHCVNEEPANAYGVANGGTPISFGFANNNRPGLINWYFGGYQTDTANAYYNSNHVAYNPGSLEPEANSFLYSDVALASLDTPASDIPTWALMFSKLPDPGEIGADGTGYHVTLTGYGNNGSASTGSTGGIDYRRHIAQNMLGALANLDTFETFQFGQPNGLYQNLYWIDFDDPKRGTADASPYDFNAWRDNAVADEGITASGDSGGPLILDDTYDIPVVIGVLSGGYTRFFNGQQPNGYGTASFYQPLYLYWDWIAANNPYHYVSAVAGNGAWEDPEHWVSTLDPNYMVLDADGKLVNGIPTAPGEGVNGSDGGFGQTCFQAGGISDCYDVASGNETVSASPIGTAGNGKAKASVSDLAAQAVLQAAADTLPAATLTNGLPGATDFIPNNSDGDAGAGIAPRYFDVTLSAAGMTTLSSAVTIDRLTLNGTDAALDITAQGDLTSLIDVTQYSGMMRVNGTLTTSGDYFLMSGGLQGSGTINTPYFTSMAGVIAPGGVGSVGTLTFNGNVILASGTVTMIDLGANGVSDKIAVNATQFVDDGTGTMVPANGMASVGGLLAVGAATGHTLRYGDTYTILTAEGGVEGAFDAAAPISAILSPSLTYGTNAVQLKIEAGLYANVINAQSPNQAAFAQLLDQNRPAYDRFTDLYTPLDMMSVSGIQASLEGFTPRIQPLLISMGTAAMETNSRLLRDRMANLDQGFSGGSVAYYGRPNQVAEQAVSFGTQLNQDVASDSTATPDRVRDGVLPDDISAFFAGGYIDGKSRGMPTATPYARDKFTGWYLAGGLEKGFNSNGFAGFSLSYSHMNGEPGMPARNGDANVWQLSFYGANTFEGGIILDAQVTAGAYDVSTSRTVAAGDTSWRLSSKDTPFLLSGEVGVGAHLVQSGPIDLTSRVALRYAEIDFGRSDEQGGGPALTTDLGTFRSVQSRAGARVEAKGTFRPYASATWVHDFKNKPSGFGANFVGGIGPDVVFALPGYDSDWAEVGAGISTQKGPVTVSLSAETTLARSDIKYQTYRGAISLRF